MKGNHRAHLRLVISILATAAVILLATALFSLAASAQDPPLVPHPTEGREACSACHGQGGLVPAPANHAALTDDLCLNCHQAATVPAIPHETTVKSDCVACHGQNSILPAPASHAGYTDTCLTCHVASGAVAPNVPHETAGADDCLTCHGADGLLPEPAGHAGYGQTICLLCHEVAAVTSLTGPDIHHAVAGLDCLDCHAAGGFLPAPASHAGYSTSACLLCHEVDAIQGPDIPHETAGQEACATCHGAQGFLPMPVSHADYPENACLLCHEVSPDAGTGTSGGPGQPIDAGSCMTCHGQPGLTMTLGDGEVLSLYLDPAVWDMSVHGDKLLCTDCHTTITTFPHQTWEIPSKREYSIAQYDLCRHCHFDNYTKTLDSIHYAIFSEGNTNTPLCTDCHGSHDITPLTQDNRRISQTCSQCHGDIYTQYINSVHGQAMFTQNNYDVPVCTDCHTSHTIEDPTTASFRLESVQLCSNCHSNAAIMDKYGISTNVVNSYLEDFHGRTVALVEKENKDIWVDEAVCTDCHGIHDIQAVDNPDSPVIKANLAVTCGKCHEDVSTNFSGAWLSHYETSFQKLPAIFMVDWFYKILIPFILAGLSIHVLLDLWRRITNR